MRLDVSQHLRLEQRMKLSPRIIQAMEILQLPLLALQERIEEELASNPCLETRDSAEGAAPAQQEERPADAGEKDLVVKEEISHQEDFERLADFGEEYAEDLDWTERPSRRRAAAGERDSKLDALANTPAPEQGLNEYLLQQWAFVEASGQVKAAGDVIISNIDANGYLRTPLEELVREGDPPITPASLQAALALVQKLDPPGVGARDLRECLLLQLDAEAAAGEEAAGAPADDARRLEDATLARQLVSDYLREIELNHIPQIAKRTGRSVQQIKAAIASLARLDPHPGRLYGQRSVPYIIPDAIIDLDEEGNVAVTMLDGTAPTLKVSRTYLKMARSGKIDPKAKEFIRRNLRAAKWLIGAISQRRQTVRRVVEEVFEAQKDFLERGQEALRPLPMMEIASKVGVHVATVSRAVAGKYVQTPRGIFALRMFFSGGTTTASGEHVAWDAVKAKLKEIIDHEDKFNPLADDQIAEALREAGIKIARRTVAKYRNLLNIPSARQRKEY